jgi:hypothetical protein
MVAFIISVKLLQQRAQSLQRQHVRQELIWKKALMKKDALIIIASRMNALKFQNQPVPQMKDWKLIMTTGAVLQATSALSTKPLAQP